MEQLTAEHPLLFVVLATEENFTNEIIFTDESHFHLSRLLNAMNKIVEFKVEATLGHTSVRVA